MIVTESEWEAANLTGICLSSEPGSSKPPSYGDVVDLSPAPFAQTLYSASPIRQASPTVPSRRSTTPECSHSDRSVPLSGLDRDSYFLPPRHLGPFMCTFSQASFQSMILHNRDDATPYYHISVDLNCFIPSSYITTICRGGTGEGDFVGSFEMGISAKKSTVTMGGREKLMDLVLCKAGSKSDRVWQWRWHNNRELHLSWHCDSPVKYCYLASQMGLPSATLLASYTPHALSPRADGQPSPSPYLKLFPEGQRLFDDIVISALIIERKRLTPNPRSLFN